MFNTTSEFSTPTNMVHGNNNGLMNNKVQKTCIIKNPIPNNTEKQAKNIFSIFAYNRYGTNSKVKKNMNSNHMINNMNINNNQIKIKNS